MKIKLALLSSFFTISVIVLSLNACKKDLKDTSSKNINADESVSLSPELQSQSSGTGNGYCWEDGEDGSVYDSVLKPTILGARLIGNPYSVANMQQASINLTNSSAGIVENAWYVRVKPSNYEQLTAVEDLDVDWFDYPLDYELIQEGDYYDDGVTSNPLHPADLVANYTNAQFFNALENDVFGLPGFRQRLLSQNSNNQANNVISLFGFYNY